MVISFILIVCFLLGRILEKRYDMDFLGTALSIVSGLYLAIHLFFISFSSYSYELWVTERNSFISTMDVARSKNNDLENATITKEVIEWNRSLASSKLENKTFLLKDYIDDRCEKLQPIK